MASPQPQANPPLLHRFLGFGLLIMSVTAAGLKVAGVVPLLPPDDFTRTMGYGVAGMVVIMLAVAFLIFKPRVPERRMGQPFDEYWATPDVATKALQVWFLMEGAGVLGLVGYFITGEPLAALAAGLAVAAFWLTGPNVFAKP